MPDLRPGSLLQKLFPVFAFCLLIGVHDPASAAKKLPPPDTEVPAAPAAKKPVASEGSPPAPATPAKLGVVAQGASQGGVRKCLGRIEQVVGFVTAGSQSGAMMFLTPGDPDRGLASISLETINATAGLSYVATDFSPTPGGCTAAYEAVNYWNTSCDKVAANNFPSFPRAKPLHNNIDVLDGGPSAKVFLMPAGLGCVSIKKEVLF